MTCRNLLQVVRMFNMKLGGFALKDLSYMYSTHSFHRTIVDGKRKDIMNTTIVTPSGEISEKKWIELIEKQAKEKLELDILDKLKSYALNELAWIHADKEAYEHALNMYSIRMWENPKWVGYEEFNIDLNKKNELEQISLFQDVE